MRLKRLLRPTNRRIRLLVGLLLAGLFCIQCTQTDTFRSSNFVLAVSAKDVAKTSSGQLARLEKLARTDHIALLELCLDNYSRRHRDYRCTFVKQERINGILGKEQWIDVKFMDQPFSVAMKWTRNVPIGERVLYVEGKYDNQMLVRPRGLLYRIVGTVKRKPDSPEVMRNTLRPVNKFGFRRATQNLLGVYVTAREQGDLKQTFGGYADVAGRRTIALVRYLPAKDDYPAHKTVTFIDLEHLVPVCIEGYDWQGELSCRYVYKDVAFDVGLAAKDFTPQANDMKPPKE